MSALVCSSMKTKPTFLGLPRATTADLAGTSVAVIGISEDSPYSHEPRSHSAKAPKKLRKLSQAIARSLSQYDFDLEATLLPDADDFRGLVDLGDVATDSRTSDSNRRRIREAVASILDAGAVPIVLGGDDSVPIPVIAAYEGHGPIVVLQIDAHVDWADVIAGNPYGYGSPMRRASEYAWVTGMVQVGIRGLGSGQSWQHDDARRWGSHIVTAYRFHQEGLDSVLRHIPDGAAVFVSIDCDGLDPACFPAVNMPTPGGLGYEEMIGLLRGVAAKARIAGVGLFEYVPARDDAYRLSGQIAVRLAMASMAFILAGRDRAPQAAGTAVINTA